MNIKEMLLPLSLALFTTFAIQYFFFGNKNSNGNESVRSGQSFSAPRGKQEFKPLNQDVDFVDEKRSQKEVKTIVDTNIARLYFTSDGAALDRIEYKNKENSALDNLSTVFPVGQTEKENKCFLVGLDQKTPYYYTFEGRKDTPTETKLTYYYKSSFADATIYKTFTIFKDTYKIDVEIEVNPIKKSEDGQNVRLFFPSPLMPEISKSDVVSSVISNEKGALKKISQSKIDFYTGWFKPQVFGSENKFFIHAMIEDSNEFVERAYYKKTAQNSLVSILESPDISEKTKWNLSFYFGPKEDKAMAAVDSRLEETLAYSGILSPISKFLLSILKLLKDYVHNFGFAIILLTILIKLILLPFSWKATEGAKKQAEFQKKLKYLEQKYKHDKQALAHAKAELIRKHGMPGLGSCLPLLLQLPVFFSLSRVLSSSIEFYKAPFLWISDLSSSDPYYVMPILITSSMLLQASTADPKQRTMIMVMAFVFGAVASNFASGLTLYICISTLLGVLQATVQKKLKAS